jgi:hypothetical protein
LGPFKWLEKRKKFPQNKEEVEEVGRYLLTVRAQYLFLMSLCKKYKENDAGIEDERRSFCRYCTILSILV